MLYKFFFFLISLTLVQLLVFAISREYLQGGAVIIKRPNEEKYFFFTSKSDMVALKSNFCLPVRFYLANREYWYTNVYGNLDGWDSRVTVTQISRKDPNPWAYYMNTRNTSSGPVPELGTWNQVIFQHSLRIWVLYAQIQV